MNHLIAVKIDSRMFSDLVAAKRIKVAETSDGVSIELELGEIGIVEILSAIDRAFLQAPEWLTVAQSDPALSDWLFGVLRGKPTPAGSFLRTLVEAAFAADPKNYRLMRPILAEMKRKYPKYSDGGGAK
jgi:hypothetical protein